jgi:hypothetical protein
MRTLTVRVRRQNEIGLAVGGGAPNRGDREGALPRFALDSDHELARLLGGFGGCSVSN